MTSLSHNEDKDQMNWIEGKRLWGEVVCPAAIHVEIKREFTKDGNLRESFQFTNNTSFPVFLEKTDLGIYTTFNDNYQEASECLEKRCHTHIFCGEEASYVMALRMSGRGPHLGMKFLKGSVLSYSVERNLEQRSNDRGDFILHPHIAKLEPEAGIEIQRELFWFETKEEFYEELLRTQGFPVVFPDQCTYFKGESMRFKIAIRDTGKKEAVRLQYNGMNIPYRAEVKDGIRWISAYLLADREGEYRIDIQAEGKKTFLCLYCCAVLDKMAERRCRFLALKQQMHDVSSHLDGAYLIYDREEDSIYYSHQDDHNGGRERLAMGSIMAFWQRLHPDGELKKSLEKYERYVYRELYDREKGTVYNDICHNLEWNRLYNYPWMAQFQLELYKLKGEGEYLMDAYKVMEQYYMQGGISFYGIGIPVTELYKELEGAGMGSEAGRILSFAERHADNVLQNGVHYPESEVAYEQSIVAPAVSILLQGYEITRNTAYLDEAKRQLKVLSLFNGRQPDYHLFENAIRHWDGFWFGKYRRYGDTFPHYWSVLTGVEYIRYEILTGDSRYRKRAAASIRGCLNLFFPDGFASSAMVFPEKINGEAGHYYDPWANDQDWALYYALKYRSFLEDISFDLEK
ncbi:DUF5695 domain-containing protein [Faecalicatena orotica]|uniref:Six-hairpin glycosidase n=2 Tax=Faecalicatena orotica TaxID=1544 RepID=A0A2Y9BDE9_9FIRM|nr:hypothetical protein A8806_101764 [Faecalicatena orotica]SSA54308.1 hypothetical protein SAMN05216536_101764 [Faecalicatena orotica]